MTSDFAHNTDPTISTPPAVIEKSRLVVVFTFYALLCTYTAYGLWQVPDGNIAALGFLWILKMVPLLIFTPGMRRRHLRTFAWLSFVVLLYFVVSVQTAFVEQTRVYGIVVTLLLSVLFCALVVYIRSYREFYKTSL
ncbi:MAG: DUF2069 domain-containing protein [Pseudomonadota bacterium]